MTAYRDGEVTLRSNRRTEGYTVAILEQGYQGVRSGQLVINSMDAFAGAIGVSDSNGKCSPEYVVCDPVYSDEVAPRYYALLLREMALRNYIQVICPAVRQRALRIRYSSLAPIFLPVPPLSEQIRIVEFLDRKTAEIDEAIAQKQRLIELLEEQKGILINQTVTKGLDPDVPMRDSGVEWIGRIPSHWKVVHNRRFLKKIEQGSSPAIVNSDNGENCYVLKISAVKQGRYISKETKNIPKKHFMTGYQVRKGDLLMTR